VSGRRAKDRRRASGTGNVYQPKYKDRATGEWRESPFFHIRYTVNGQQKREATKTTSQTEAERILRNRLLDLEHGRPTGPQIDKTTVGDLADGLLTEYRINRRRSIKSVEDSVAHWLDFFTKESKARTIDPARIEEYVAHRQKEGRRTGRSTGNRRP